MTLDKAVIVLCNPAGKQRFRNMIMRPAVIGKIENFKKFVRAVDHVALGVKFAHAESDTREFYDLSHFVSQPVDRDILFLNGSGQIVKLSDACSGQRTVSRRQSVDSGTEGVDRFHENVRDHQCSCDGQQQGHDDSAKHRHIELVGGGKQYVCSYQPAQNPLLFAVGGIGSVEAQRLDTGVCGGVQTVYVQVIDIVFLAAGTHGDGGSLFQHRVIGIVDD